MQCDHLARGGHDEPLTVVWKPKPGVYVTPEKRHALGRDIVAVSSGSRRPGSAGTLTPQCPLELRPEPPGVPADGHFMEPWFRSRTPTLGRPGRQARRDDLDIKAARPQLSHPAPRTLRANRGTGGKMVGDNSNAE